MAVAHPIEFEIAGSDRSLVDALWGIAANVRIGARPLDRALTDGEITLRSPTDGEAEILVAERDAEIRTGDSRATVRPRRVQLRSS